MRVHQASFVLLMVISCVTAYTLRDLFNALDEKEKTAATQVKTTTETPPPAESEEDDEETVILKKVLELLEARKKAKLLQKGVSEAKKTVTLRDQHYGPSGLDNRNLGPYGQPKDRNFGPQGGLNPNLRNFGPQGKPDTGANLQERNFGMYGREIKKQNSESSFAPSGFDLFERNFGQYGRQLIRTMIDEELEKLLAKTKNKQ